MRRVILQPLLMLFGCLQLALAVALPTSNPVPGGIAIVSLKQSENESLPNVLYRKRRVMVIKQNQQWFAIVGIPLAAEPGQHSLSIKSPNNPYKIAFNVAAKKYETQHLTIKNKRMVNPSKKDLDRIIKEKKIIQNAFQKWRATSIVGTQFTLPTEGRLSSPFGLRRYFNGQPRKPHSGIDIAAPKGTPLRAPAGGKIVAIGNFFFNGNSVFIDHGQGLVTMYCHMDTINVKPGQDIKQGEQFGTVGMTGRVTGPHVHWSVSLNNTRIDPTLFFPKETLDRLIQTSTDQ